MYALAIFEGSGEENDNRKGLPLLYTMASQADLRYGRGNPLRLPWL